MGKIRIKIKYSKTFEIERIMATLKKLEWFKKRKYSITFPSDLNLNVENYFSKRYIRKILEKEYRVKDYKRISLMIKRKWNKLSERLLRGFSKLGIKMRLSYSIYLTKYGTKGSYRLPNIIIINIQGSKSTDVIRTIIHEVIHVAIEDKIFKYNISHWQKERIVDLIISKLFPKFSKIQRSPEKTKEEMKKVDKFFKEFYPNITEILKKISS